jgi:uncharacterized sulfatase
MFEESIRVPLIIRWPGKVRPGIVIDHVVSNLDLFPTILDVVEICTPANLYIHGRSLVPMLTDKATSWDDTLFGQYDMHHSQVARMRMNRNPERKLIRHFEPGGRDELYHLAADPGETKNLAGSRDVESKNQEQDLNRRLLAWTNAIGDPLASR